MQPYNNNKQTAKRVVTFANRDDYVSFRHHVYTAPAGPKSVELKEVRCDLMRFDA